MLGGIGGRRRRGRQRMRWLDGITDTMDMSLEWTPGVGDGQGGLACCDSWGRRIGHDWATELNWREKSERSFDILLKSQLRNQDFLNIDNQIFKINENIQHIPSELILDNFSFFNWIICEISKETFLMFSKSFAVCFPDFFLDLLSRISDNVKSYSSYLTDYSV